MKTTYRHNLQSIHLVLAYKDKPSEQLADIFHAAMRMLDTSYPLDPMRKCTDTVKHCQRCGGVIWSHPMGYMEPKVLKLLAKQLGIKVKIKAFLEHCSGEVEERLPTF